MFTAILLTSPASPSLDPALVDSLRNAWGGGDAIWLATDEAAEFSLATKPDNVLDVWADLQKMGVDLIVTSSLNRKKRVLLADMDSTMIEQECIDELAAEAGVGERVAEITARAMNGELDFADALTERVGLLRGLPVSIIDKVIAERITLRSGGKELIATMKANGAYTALVSGGFTAFTSRVGATLGFDENRANTLIEADAELTGEYGLPILGADAKLEALEEIIAQRNLTKDDVMAVGDGANDLRMIHNSGAGVALHAKPAVQEQADIRINFGDLTALLYLQGYAKTDFVT